MRVYPEARAARRVAFVSLLRRFLSANARDRNDTAMAALIVAAGDREGEDDFHAMMEVEGSSWKQETPASDAATCSANSSGQGGVQGRLIASPSFLLSSDAVLIFHSFSDFVESAFHLPTYEGNVL